jgi:hypothetical protein
MNPRILVRTWLAALVACLPLLALLLIPQLMRSRAGSGHLLIVGTVLLLAMLTAAFLVAPLLSARALPEPGRWDRWTARRSTVRVWREQRGRAFGAIATGILIYGLGQAVGYGLAAVMPYIDDNPAFATDPSQSPWILHYPAYALQAVVLYAITTLAVSVYAAMLRGARIPIGLNA